MQGMEREPERERGTSQGQGQGQGQEGSGSGEGIWGITMAGDKNGRVRAWAEGPGEGVRTGETPLEGITTVPWERMLDDGIRMRYMAGEWEGGGLGVLHMLILGLLVVINRDDGDEDIGDPFVEGDLHIGISVPVHDKGDGKGDGGRGGGR